MLLLLLQCSAHGAQWVDPQVVADVWCSCGLLYSLDNVQLIGYCVG